MLAAPYVPRLPQTGREGLVDRREGEGCHLPAGAVQQAQPDGKVGCGSLLGLPEQGQQKGVAGCSLSTVQVEAHQAQRTEGSIGADLAQRCAGVR